MKRIISMLLLVISLTSVFSIAFASSEIVPYASQIFSVTSVHTDISGGKVKGAANAKSWVTADTLGMSSMALYEENSSGGWTRVASASSKYGYNTMNYSYTISATAKAGKEYKFVATFYGKDGSITDSVTRTTYVTN